MKKRVILLTVLLIVFLTTYAQATEVSSYWKYNFSTEATLYETGSMTESTSPYFWLNSGGKLILTHGRGMTIQEELPTNDYWRKAYAKENPLDTDNGYHPQNIFRLVTKSKWQNYNQTIYFKITNDQLSTSPNRAEHNGILLMSRYNSGDTLYYAGIRVDGSAIIKKKLDGTYTTLVSNQIFPGTYNRESKPSLLPKNTWIGLRSQTITNEDGSVTLKLYMDKNWNNKWILIAEATDENNPIITEGYAGIRTDFMDVIIDNYELKNFN